MSNFFDNFPSALELFLNLIELIALVLSITTFLILMINKFSKALRKILSPCGMGFFPRIRALFICRKSQIKKRAFIEYAILETKGCIVINSTWHAIINSFKAYYSETDNGNIIYSIPNCTPVIETSFSEVTERYFKFFSQPKVRKAFGIQDDNLSWVTTIQIEEAYATPTCLLTGLLSQYDENWDDFIKRYVSTAYITESDGTKNNVLSNELYFTFAWLLWGPSYELEYKNYWAGLCQLSFGDESNSIPAIANTESNVAIDLKNKFLDNDDHRYGALLTANVTICDKKPFYSMVRENINPTNTYFYNKVENGDLSFGVRIDSFTPCLNYKSKKYYTTAYVWVLFELEDDDYAFKPEKSVAFFEHANLADKSTYGFLVDSLIDKSLKHFESIFLKEKHLERKYRFVCAMNDRIAIQCVNKYKEIMNSGTPLGNILKNNVILEPKHYPADVFTAYDNYFLPSTTLKYIGVSLTDQGTISDLGQFYTNIYMQAFQDDDERESFDNFLKYLKKAETAKEYKYHIVLAKNESNVVIGGCIFNYFKKSNSGVIEFLAVRSDLQSSGVGTMIYKHVLSVLSEDAYQHNNKHVEYICCEIDSPEYSKAEVKKYLYFWHKNNFGKLNFNYVQPALSANQHPVTGLWFTISSQHQILTKVSSKLIVDILYDYIKYAMSIDHPEQLEDFIKMKNELLQKDTIEISKIL